MSLMSLADDITLKEIKDKYKPEFDKFKNLNEGGKIYASEKLFLQNKLYEELGKIAIDTIEDLDVELEMKTKENDILKNKLKNIDQYNEKEVQALLNNHVVIKSHNYERAKKRLKETIKKSSNK